MTFHFKGLLVFASFAAVLSLSTDPRWGVVALAAWAVVEALLWAGVAGFGRHSSMPPPDSQSR
jgi:hypothetical protein